MRSKELVLRPVGWPCTLYQCPPGFFLYNGNVCFKTEYRSDNKMEVFCESGEFFCASTKTEDEKEKLEVQPLEADWIVQ